MSDLCKPKTAEPWNIRQLLSRNLTPRIRTRMLAKISLKPLKPVILIPQTLLFLKLHKKLNTRLDTSRRSLVTRKTNFKRATKKVKTRWNPKALFPSRIRYLEVSTRKIKMENLHQRTSLSRAHAGTLHSVVTSFMAPKEELAFADLNSQTRNANGLWQCVNWNY